MKKKEFPVTPGSEIILAFSVSAMHLQLISGSKSNNGNSIKTAGEATQEELKDIFKRYLKKALARPEIMFRLESLSKKIIEKVIVTDEKDSLLLGRSVTSLEIETILKKATEIFALEEAIEKAEISSKSKSKSILESALHKAIKWGRLEKSLQISGLLGKPLSNSNLKDIKKIAIKTGRLADAKKITEIINNPLTDQESKTINENYFRFGWLDGNAKITLIIQP